MHFERINDEYLVFVRQDGSPYEYRGAKDYVDSCEGRLIANGVPRRGVQAPLVRPVMNFATADAGQPTPSMPNNGRGHGLARDNATGGTVGAGKPLVAPRWPY